MDEERDFQRGKELAINYLSYRPRSSTEVRTHLIGKGYPSELADRVVQYLTESAYLNDQEFARRWYLSRLKKGGYGPLLITRELLARGISPEICTCLMEQFYPDEKEREEALRLMEKRGVGRSNDLREKRRVYQALLRRGFSPAVIAQVLKMKTKE